VAITPGPDKSTGQMPGYKDELPFAVEEWNSSTGAYVRDIARASNLKVARAAFRAVVAEYPALHIKLRNRALVLDERQSARS
jgi:hypothetical protein